jgi:poly(3-hydroxybutyrate) depolymerase
MRDRAVLLASLVLLWACSGEDGSGAAGTTGSTSAGQGGGGQGSTTTATGSAGGGMGGSGMGGSGAGGSSGCAKGGAPTGVLDGTIDANNKTRTYILSVPAGYDPANPLPLVFAWHGLGGSGNLARLYFNVEEESNGQAIFVYPDGLPLESQGGAAGWDLMDGGDDVQLFDDLLVRIGADYCIDEGRIFSTGHSYGGFMSNALGCFRGDVLRAIAPVAGGGPFSQNCTGPLTAWLAHGNPDPVVDFQIGQGSRDHWLTANGCGAGTAPVEPAPCVAYDGCQGGTAVHWCVHTQEHNWPDFAGAGVWGFFAGLP